MSFTARHQFEGPAPRRSAFIGGHLVFGRPEIDREVRSDPEMYYMGDEITGAPRYWTHGFNIYQPGVRCVFHLYLRISTFRKKEQEISVNTCDGPRTGAELRRMEVLLGAVDGAIDFGRFGLGTARTLPEYEAFAGVCFRDRSIRRFAYDGAYDIEHGPRDMEPFDWIGFSRENGLDLGRHKELSCQVPEGVMEKFRRRCAERAMPPEIALQKALEAWTDDGTDRFRAEVRADISRLPGSRYLEQVGRIESPDLMSAILIEIPAYCDPEIVNTVKAARAMAANPDRIHFAVCLQDDDLTKLDALRAVPGCKVKHYMAGEAPGACAARSDCQAMYGGEDFVFHMDAHMRFAKYWDVAIIDQWSMCGDGKAILTEYPKGIRKPWLGLPLDDDLFIEQAETRGQTIKANYFSGNRCELRCAPGRAFESDTPVPAAFIAAGCSFCRAGADIEVPVDPNMDFTGDESAMAARYWTHGYDFYHPAMRFIYHLYERENVYKDKQVRPVASPVGPDGLTRSDRQARRLEKLLGMYDRPDVDLGGYALGTVRTLEEYQSFAGVDFRRLIIRKFSADGRCDLPHTEEDMGAVDWKQSYKNYYKRDIPDPGEKLDLNVPVEVRDAFMEMCGREHWHPQAALAEAVRRWLDGMA